MNLLDVLINLLQDLKNGTSPLIAAGVSFVLGFGPIFLFLQSAIGSFSDTGYDELVRKHRRLLLVARLAVAIAAGVGSIWSVGLGLAGFGLGLLAFAMLWLWRWPVSQEAIRAGARSVLVAVRWACANWQLVLATVLVGSVAVITSHLANSYWPALLVVALFLASVLFALWLHSTHTTKRPNEQAVAAEEAPSGDRVLFSDSDFPDWHQFEAGNVTQVDEQVHSPPYSLKKRENRDPHGGYKVVDESFGPGFLFRGWLYRPSGEANGHAESLAIENGLNKGYGFGVNHFPNQRIWINSRTGPKDKQQILGTPVDCAVPYDDWYFFKFFTHRDGRLVFKLYGSSATKLLGKVQVQLEEIQTSFDRVVVHGGSPYYVDDLEIVAI